MVTTPKHLLAFVFFSWLQTISSYNLGGLHNDHVQFLRAEEVLSKLEPIELTTPARFIHGLDTQLSDDVYESAVMDILFFVVSHTTQPPP